MHMALMISGGIVLLGLFVLFGKLRGGDARALVIAAQLFIPTWLAISLVNLWVGVARAGYALRQELLILAGVFLLPAVLAFIFAWGRSTH